MSSTDGARGLARLFEGWNRRAATMGVLALAALFVAVVTGVLLAVAFDVRAAADSVQVLEIASPAGRVVRALHAWAGHLLVILAVLHAIEHLLRASERRLRLGVWLRVLLSAAAIFAVMLTGFMLKGDAEGRLARQIATGMLDLLPFLGPDLAASLLGTGDDLQLPYVHHLATFTVIIAVTAIEHGRRIWPSAGGLIGVVSASALLAWLLPPSLHDGLDAVVKGPWYFVGIQEILHWMPAPGWLWVPVFGLLLAGAWLPRAGERARRGVLVALAVLLVAYLLVSVWAQVFRGAGWQVRWPGEGGGSGPPSSRAPADALRTLALSAAPGAEIPVILGAREGCVLCHDAVSGLSPSHDPKVLGCRSCHLGDPFTADADRAHHGMVRVPGNLDTAPEACGQAGCHGEIVRRVEGSLMARVVGMVAVDRWVFGEVDGPDGDTPASALGDSPADTHLRQLCVSCHLGKLKREPGPVGERSRGGGCTACHVAYGDGPRYTAKTARAFEHPRLTVRVDDDKCFGCHSRSGRISLSYRGWSETLLAPADVAGRPPGDWRVLEDGRVLRREPADVHFERGMACVDCHSSRELMGDGRQHRHEDEATEVRCADCHRRSPPRTVGWEALDAESRAILRIREGGEPRRAFLLAGESGRPLVNVSVRGDGAVEVRGKLTGKVHLAGPPAEACSAVAGHERLSCRSCHAAWVPQCISCHTQYEPGARSIDLLTDAEREGAWVEYDGEPAADPPVLGVRERGGRTAIEPFAPGMIMTLNLPGEGPKVAGGSLPDDARALVGPGTRTWRLYAPAAPHTTARAGRPCRSCHSEPLAYGYGRGQLAVEAGDGGPSWVFRPRYGPSLRDGLPADAWVGFRQTRTEDAATRTNARPLGVEAQRRGLEVAACFGCHEPDDPAQALIYEDFATSRSLMSPSCRVPVRDEGERAEP